MAALRASRALRYYFLEYQNNCSRRADNALRNRQFQDLFEKNPALMDVARLAGPPPGRRDFTARGEKKKGRPVAGLAAGGRSKVTRLQPGAGDLLVSAE